jgi:hypothetical protein
MRLFEQETHMRIVYVVFAGALVTSALLTAPAVARNAEAQKGDDKSTSASSSCSAYQMGADGSWEPLPCRETGERSQPATQQKSRGQGADQSDR